MKEAINQFFLMLFRVFSPPDHETSRIRRFKQIIAFSFAYASCGILYAPLYYFLGSPVGALAIILADIFILFAPLILKRTGSIGKSGNWIIFHVYWLLAFLACVNGGYMGPSMIWNVSIPMAAAFLIGIQSGVFWFAMIYLQILVFFLLKTIGFEFPQHFTEEGTRLMNIISVFGISFVVLSFAMIYEKFNKEALALVEKLAVTDELTRLWNRRGFIALIDQQRRVAQRKQKRLAFIFADVDKFKSINDKYGHAEGDRALVHIAKIFESATRGSDVVARIAGDEFVVVSIEEKKPHAVILLARLKEKIEEHNDSEITPYKLSISFGVSFHDPDQPLSLEKMIEKSDKRMYEFKPDYDPRDSEEPFE